MSKAPSTTATLACPAERAMVRRQPERLIAQLSKWRVPEPVSERAGSCGARHDEECSNAGGSWLSMQGGHNAPDQWFGLGLGLNCAHRQPRQMPHDATMSANFEGPSGCCLTGHSAG